MKIDLGQYSDVDVVSTKEQKNFRLADGAEKMIFQMFSKNIYSNPIGSIVREITSNAFDSHVEAGVNFPVKIIRRIIDNKIYFSFIDYGVGMSPERINTIFSVYFQSTKRSNNDEIGGFGLGSKTPLAYRRYNRIGNNSDYDNSYYIITTFDKVKYHYLVHEGKDSPQITLIHEEPTTERNGTEVRVPVLQTDATTFETECLNQLYYFENIIFEGFETNYETMNNFKIIQGKNFLFRGSRFSNIHICLGRVRYPIDYNALDISSFDNNIPIALRFNIGDLNVTASRESIDYSAETIKKIKDKIDAAKEELMEILSKQNDEIKTISDFIEKKEDLYIINFGDDSPKLSIKDSNLSSKNFDLKNYKFSDIIHWNKHETLFELLFDAKLFGVKEPRYIRSSDECYRGRYADFMNNKNLYHIEDEYNRVVMKQSYLKTKHPKRYYILSKSTITPATLENAVHYLIPEKWKTLTDTEKTTILEEIQEELFELVKRRTVSYDDLIIPDEFRKRKTRVNAEIKKITIPIKNYNGQHRSNERVKLSSLTKLNTRIFYGTSEDSGDVLRASIACDALFKTASIYFDYNGHVSYYDENKKNVILFIVVSKTNIKYLKQMDNTHHVSEFERILFRRKEDILKLSYIFHKIKDEYYELPSYLKAKKIETISYDLRISYQALRNFISDNKSIVLDSTNVYKVMKLGYFNTENLLDSKEHKRMQKHLDCLNNFNQKHSKYMKFISAPYYLDDESGEDFWVLLKKITELS